MKMTSLKTLSKLAFAGLVLAPMLCFAQDKSADEIRRDLIVKAFQANAQEFVDEVTAEDIRIKDGSGRADVNKKVKYSYYIHTENPADPKSPIVLIPMATSRYAPTYYQTDEWWDAHKAEIDAAKAKGVRPPQQDSAEVAAWLKEMKLSTNPIVLKIDANQRISSVRLQEYLSDYYIQNFAQDGKVTLYRGGERETETGDWLRGVRPKGSRYWTPTANYGWRYARKNATFLKDLINGKPAIYVFEVPLAEFKRLTREGRYPDLTLGTELTKQAHNNFDMRGTFTDNIGGGLDYMGIGKVGVEFEVRSNSAGANSMAQYFKRVITIQELVTDRVKIIRETSARVQKMRPANAEQTRAAFLAREEKTVIEGKLLYAVQNNFSKEAAVAMLSAYRSARGPAELTDSLSGENFESLINQKISALQSKPAQLDEELRKLESVFKDAALICGKAFN